MAAKSKIEWTDATWNPVSGCTKVSQGCKNCYAERDWARLVHLPAYFGRSFSDVRCHQERLDQPLHWKKPRRIFVNSMSDLFHEAVPDEFIAQVFLVMANSNHHTYQVLTKRPQRMRQWFEKLRRRGSMVVLPTSEGFRGYSRCDAICVGLEGEWPLPNVWLGVSVEDQVTANERIPLLLDTPAAVRWISAEPLLEPIYLKGLFGLITDDEDVRIDALEGTFITSRYQEEGTPLGAKLDWIVVGGESGPKARPMHPNWVRSLRDQCAAAGVPFLFKQWGEWAPYCTHEEMIASEFHLPTEHHYVGISPDGTIGRDISNESGMYWTRRLGKKASGRLLDGVIHDGYPEERP